MIDYTTPITTEISQKMAWVMLGELSRKNPSELSSERLQANFGEVIRSLEKIGDPNSPHNVTWSLPLADMRVAVVWIVRYLMTVSNAKNPQLNKPEKELQRLAKELIPQIRNAGEIDFINWLTEMAPELMMEINCGINPLAGTIDIANFAGKSRP